MTWLQELLPPPEKIDSWQGSVMELRDKIKDFEIDPKYAEMGKERMTSLKEWFDERLDRAIKATEEAEETKQVQDAQQVDNKGTTLLQRMTAGR